MSYPAVQVALPPNYPTDSTMFAAGSGFWRLPPAASTWVPAASGLLSTTNVIAVAVSPAYATDRTVFAAFGFWTWGYSVYRSSDGGATWQLLAAGLNAYHR